MNIIKDIEVFYDKRRGDWDKFDGYRISTTNGVIEIAVDSFQNCCENWGYISSNNNFSDFCGAEILEIKYTQKIDEVLETVAMQLSKEGVTLDDIYFITFETSKGTLQFVVYNEHNGYYGHDCYVSCDFIKEMNFEKII